MSESLPTTPSKGDRWKEIESAMTSRFDALIAKAEENMLGSVAEIVTKYDIPDRSGLPEFQNRSGETVHRLQSPTEPLYRSLPAEIRRYRNPDSDHWMKQFLAGVIQNDGAQRAQAAAKLDGMYPEFQSRADTLEGAADAAGGFAGGTGGVLLPRVMENLVAIARDAIAKMARFATTYQMEAQEHNIPTGAAMTAFMVGEVTSPVTQGEPTWAQVPLIAHRGAAKAIIGNDLLEDAAVNVVNFLVMRGGAKLGVLEDLEFFQLGTGSAPHVTKLSGTAFSEDSSGILKYVDVVNMYKALPQVYRPGARWFVAPDVLGFMANVRDGNGRPFYQSLFDAPQFIGDDPTGGQMAGQTGTILGRPVHEVPLTNGDIWFGDPMAVYSIGRRHGIRVDTSREFLFDSFRTIFLIHQRFAGNNIDTAGAQYATGITSATSE